MGEEHGTVANKDNDGSSLVTNDVSVESMSDGIADESINKHPGQNCARIVVSFSL